MQSARVCSLFLLFAFSVCSDAAAFSSPSLPLSLRELDRRRQDGMINRLVVQGGDMSRRSDLRKPSRFRLPLFSSLKDEPRRPIASVLSLRHSVSRFCNKHFFLVGMFVAVAAARAFPALGKNGGILQPERFIGQYGVTIIFLLSGLSLQLKQLRQAVTNVRLNALIQFTTFALWPMLMSALLRCMPPGLLPSPLLDGLLIVSCLPTTVNMCVILTSSAGGNVAAALANAVASNLAGILLTPALLYRFFGSNTMNLPFLEMMLKLSNKVLLPVLVGQLLRATPILSFYTKHASFFKRSQEVILLSILWNAFCTAISSPLGLDLNVTGWLLFATLVPLVHGASLAGAFLLFARCNFSRDNVVAAAFCASHKTLAFGLPLIHTMFHGSPHLASYCAPIMLLHPVQLIMGSLLLPRFQSYTNADIVPPS
jgi:solute carrier family 10 (sodium/bile acid cotransporter), member 7